MSEAKVKIVVKSSKCHHYQAGDVIYVDGPLVDKERSANICLTAMSAIYPFIYAARKNVDREGMGFDELTFQCPDGPETVEFTLYPYKDESL